LLTELIKLLNERVICKWLSHLATGRVPDQVVILTERPKLETFHCEGQQRTQLRAARSGVRSFRRYDLRHTWATQAAMAGVDLVTLAALLGHSRVQMVMRYAHPTEEHQFNAMKKVEAFVAGGLKKH
jgi:integrase